MKDIKPCVGRGILGGLENWIILIERYADLV